MRDEIINIVCLLWKGNFRKRDYRNEDVWRLYNNVVKFLPEGQSFKFLTLTNDMDAELPGMKLKLKHNWPGWWSKMEVFRPDMPEGKTLYIDLDSRIINSLEPVLEYDDDFVLFPTSTPIDKQKGKNWFEKKGIVWRYHASTMLINEDMSWLYEKFKSNSDYYMKMYRSEQDIYSHWLPNLNTFPSNWYCKLMSVKKGGIPPENCIFITGGLNGADIRDLYFAPWIKQLTGEK